MYVTVRRNKPEDFRLLLSLLMHGVKRNRSSDKPTNDGRDELQNEKVKNALVSIWSKILMFLTTGI